jgi:glutathionylspermidine synthase
MNAIEVQPGFSGDPMRDPAIHRELAARYLVWDAFVSGSRRVDLRPLVLSQDLHRAAITTAEGAVRVLGAVSRVALAEPAERERYGFHPDVDRLAQASFRAHDDAALMRVDLLLGRDGRWRVCEVNADCPGGLNEAYGLPRLSRVAGYRQGTNPTHVVEALATRLSALAERSGEPRGAVSLTFATAYAEDLQLCAFVERALRRMGTETVLAPPTAFHLCEGALCARSRPIAALYRYFPTEYLAGIASVGAIADAVESGKLKTLTSFQWMYLQSKAVMARAWALRDRLAPEDLAALGAAVPYTLDASGLSSEQLVRERGDWVLKRCLGRVGDEVVVGPLWPDEAWKELVGRALDRRLAGERWVAQRFVEQQPVATPWGDRYVTLGAYLLDGRFVGYFARITPTSHVSHDALVVPVFVEQGR